jgi:nucleoside-diphosphate-sugar epimerase
LADNSKARVELGWEPKISLKEGLLVVDEFEKRFPPSGFAPTNLILKGV